MSDTKHTPGPYQYKFHRNGPVWGWDITAVDGGRLIARIPGGLIWEDEPSPTDEANARFLTTTPDLLAALEALVANPSDDWRDATEDADGHLRTPLQRVLNQANAAIAKSKSAITKTETGG